MRCPNCKEGFIPAFSKIMPLINCDICGGTGELPEGMEYDPERGKKLREERIESGEGYKSLLLFCQYTGCGVLERSRQERGFFKKD